MGFVPRMLLASAGTSWKWEVSHVLHVLRNTSPSGSEDVRRLWEALDAKSLRAVSGGTPDRPCTDSGHLLDCTFRDSSGAGNRPTVWRATCPADGLQLVQRRSMGLASRRFSQLSLVFCGDGIACHGRRRLHCRVRITRASSVGAHAGHRPGDHLVTESVARNATGNLHALGAAAVTGGRGIPADRTPGLGGRFAIKPRPY